MAAWGIKDSSPRGRVLLVRMDLRLLLERDGDLVQLGFIPLHDLEHPGDFA